MNTFTILPKKRNEEDHLETEISSIIDSRIQYLESRSTSLFHTTALAKAERGVNLERDYDSFMTQVKKLNKTIRYLSILRSWLTTRNTYLILDLLTTNTFLNYTEEALARLLCR